MKTSQTIRSFLVNNYYNFLNFLLIISTLSSTFHYKISKKLMLATFLVASFKYINFTNIKILLTEPLFKVILLFLAYISITLFWTPDFHEGRGNVQNYLYYFILPIIIFSLIPNKKYINIITNTYVVAIVTTSLISYAIYFKMLKFSYFRFGLWPNVKMYSVFIPSNLYSVLVALGILLLLYNFIHSNYIKKTLYLFPISSLLYILVLSGGRTGQVTLIAILVIISIVYSKTSVKTSLLILLTLLLISYTAYSTNKNFKNRTSKIYTETISTLNTKDYTTSVGVRLFSYVIANEYVKNYNFLVGEGAGSALITKNTIIKKYLSKEKEGAYRFPHFHQNYIRVFVQYGLIGLVLFLLMFYYIYKIKIKDSKINYIKNIILLTMLISNIFEELLFVRDTMLIFAIFIGIIIAQKIQENKDIKSK